jgi:hypothetical protein
VYEDPAYREVVGRLTEKLVEKKRTLGDTDEEYPKLQKRFRERTVVEDFQ